jgi:predicted site-specific integrase-resolvase
MKSLTTEQQQSLLEIIKDEFGDDLLIEDFSEALLSMLEDLAGFESSSQQALNKLTKQLWSQYHE